MIDLARHRAPAAQRTQLLLTAALVVLALLCTFSAGNRLASMPGHAESRLSPSWFGAGNALQHAISDIDQNDFTGALRWSSIVVSRDPVGQHSASLLALSMLGTNQIAAAQRAYTVAAMTGWRDVGVQTYWMMTALGTGDEDIAAERLDALLRVGNRDAQTLDGLTSLEETAAGRNALTKRLRLTPDWASWYLHSLHGLHGEALAKRLAVISSAFDLGLRLDRRDVAKATTALRLDGEIEASARLWTHLGGGQHAGLTLADGGFEDVLNGGIAGPFDWTLLGTGAVDVRVDDDSPLHEGAALYALSSATITHRIAQQALMLPPGKYAVLWKSAGSNGVRSSDINIRILCSASDRASVPNEPEAIGRNGSISRFTIPATNCQSQIVAIEISPNTSLSHSPAWVDDVSIKPAPRLD